MIEQLINVVTPACTKEQIAYPGNEDVNGHLPVVEDDKNVLGYWFLLLNSSVHAGELVAQCGVPGRMY